MAINSCTADFEAGTNGSTIATTDAGSATPWDAVVIGTGASVKYDTTHVHGGSLAAKIAIAATAGASHLDWQSAHLGTLNTNDVGYFRAYFYLPGGNPAAAWTLVVGRQATNTPYRIRINTSGKIEILDSTNTVKATSTTSVPASAGWVRIEWQVTQNSTVGGVVARLYFTNADAASGSQDETVGTAGSYNTLSSSDSVWLGQTVSGPTNVSLWIDDVATSPTTWIGPTAAVAAAFVPQILLFG